MELLFILPLYLIFVSVGVLVVLGADALFGSSRVSPDVRLKLKAALVGLLCGPAPAFPPHEIVIVPPLLSLIRYSGESVVVAIALGSWTLTAAMAYVVLRIRVDARRP